MGVCMLKSVTVWSVQELLGIKWANEGSGGVMGFDKGQEFRGEAPQPFRTLLSNLFGCLNFDKQYLITVDCKTDIRHGALGLVVLSCCSFLCKYLNTSSH